MCPSVHQKDILCYHAESVYADYIDRINHIGLTHLRNAAHSHPHPVVVEEGSGSTAVPDVPGVAPRRHVRVGFR